VQGERRENEHKESGWLGRCCCSKGLGLPVSFLITSSKGMISLSRLSLMLAEMNLIEKALSS